MFYGESPVVVEFQLKQDVLFVTVFFTVLAFNLALCTPFTHSIVNIAKRIPSRWIPIFQTLKILNHCYLEIGWLKNITNILFANKIWTVTIVLYWKKKTDRNRWIFLKWMAMRNYFTSNYTHSFSNKIHI